MHGASFDMLYYTHLPNHLPFPCSAASYNCSLNIGRRCGVHFLPLFFFRSSSSRCSLFCLLGFLSRPPLSTPQLSQVGGFLDAQLGPEEVDVPFKLLLPVNVDDVLCAESVADGPGPVDGAEAGAFAWLQGEVAGNGEAGHGDERVGKLKRLEGYLALAVDGEPREGVVKVVALAVPLHDVGALLVVDVAHGGAGVGRYALAVQPPYVGAANGVFGQRTEAVEVEGGRGQARSVAEDAAASGGGEHGVTKAGDEVGRCCRLAHGRYEVCSFEFT